jgi:hypothetical protein
MKQSSKAELRRQARGVLESFSIPLYDKYDAGVVEYSYDPISEKEDKTDPERVVFTHKSTGAQIVVGSIWWNEERQELMQVGSNYGTLEY